MVDFKFRVRLHSTAKEGMLGSMHVSSKAAENHGKVMREWEEASLDSNFACVLSRKIAGYVVYSGLHRLMKTNHKMESNY